MLNSNDMSFTLEEILDSDVFALDGSKKQLLYRRAMLNLCKLHAEKCVPYHRILNILNFDPELVFHVNDIPFLPVRLFKDFELMSVEREHIFKTMTSSGTSGQKVSQIFLDRYNSANQTKALTNIVRNFIGNKRLPLLVIDSSTSVKSRNLFSARGAGILGFSIFGHDTTYALNDEMEIDLPKVIAFLNKHSDQPVLIFGFTFMIWKYFYKALLEKGVSLNLEKGVMIHGGGWKKMEDEAVDGTIFREKLKKLCGIERIHNYYGMVEQTGSIFMECDKGHLHSSIFSDILIRDYRDFSVKENGNSGLVQLLSLLPTSYPGHSILTEDVGSVLGEDDCECGRLGKYFKIEGRIKSAEVRGCSDAFTSNN